MLTGRPSSLVLLSLAAVLSFATTACSRAEEETGGDAQEIRADGFFTLDPNLPFEVTRVHIANGGVLGARWGAHNGPVTTTQDFSNPSAPALVTRWFVPTAVGAPLSQQPWLSAKPSELPTVTFWGRDGFVDLPFGNLTLQSYTEQNEHSTGEVFLFSRNYDTVVARAKANGFYSGVGVADGTKTRIVYSGLSPFTAEASSTHEVGLWAADVTATELAGTGNKLLGWEGYAGPVVIDNGGNVFVAADRPGAEQRTGILALAKTQTFASEAQSPATVAESGTKGTESIAVASAPNGSKGWVFAKGYDTTALAAPIYARAYTATADTVSSEGDVLAEAIKPANASTHLAVFGDPSGNLWVAVEVEDVGSWMVQLSPKTAPAPTPTP